jgi:hypothetical protein
VEFEFWMAQLIGVAAAVLGIGAYQLRGDRALIYCLAGTAGLWSLHFLLLGSLTAALTNAITVIRNLLAARFRLRKIGYVFIAGYIGFGAATWESAWDTLPTIAVCSGSAAMFFSSGLWRRAGLMLGGLLWMVFNIKVGSVPGIVVMAAEAASNGLFILRALRKPRPAS